MFLKAKISNRLLPQWYLYFLVFLCSKDICICLVGQFDFNVSETCFRVVHEALLERPTLASRVPLFLLGHFPTNECEISNFGYNSRTVGSSYMKFWQQFEINELYVCTQFRGNRSRDFGFRTRKPPRKFGVKSGLSQKRLKYGKKYFIGWYVSRYPFIPTNPLLAAMRLISFFFPFFPLKFCSLFFS